MPEILLVAAMDRELPPGAAAVALCCGIGPVEAAMSTARALAERRFAAVLHVGIAGAATLAPGTVAIGAESVYCDILDPGSTNPRVARLRPDPALLARAREALPHAPALAIATTARVGGGAGFEVEAMEGFGVLRAAQLAGVPALEIRSISNRVADVDRSRWQVERALEALRTAIAALLPRL